MPPAWAVSVPLPALPNVNRPGVLILLPAVATSCPPELTTNSPLVSCKCFPGANPLSDRFHFQ